MKITAVEWLTIQLERYYGHADIKSTAAFLRAMEMESEQIIDAYIEASENPALILDDAEQYYNKTFKNK